MAIYDTEEEQLDQLKKWWAVNQTSVIAGVVAAIVIITAVNFWQRYQTESRNQASQTFQQLLETEAKKNPDSVEKIAEKLSAENPSLAYAQFAALQLAKVKVEKGDLEGAKTVLENEIKNSGNPEIRHVARLRLIELLLATKQYEQGLQLIAALDPADSQGYSARYDELQGDIFVAMDRLDEARSAYQSAIRSGQATPLTQFKLDDITAPVFPEAKTN
ncbi:MAG: tetratricopeptide repeat protein [Methylomonas sp.]